ncbi:unnamed protein product [Litomosoides sigmodontis]|uniref:Uncharacterized protein n=1 Tax=Litomosoides sigmodontis TaxID=42156 RepID=A0A3P6SIM7_LITSI|nr:unnamed protein product [Litomosoides sigmodontis]
MADAGFYRGTSSEQDSRFTDKERKLLKQMRFEEALDEKVIFPLRDDGTNLCALQVQPVTSYINAVGIRVRCLLDQSRHRFIILFLY